LARALLRRTFSFPASARRRKFPPWPPLSSGGAVGAAPVGSLVGSRPSLPFEILPFEILPFVILPFGGLLLGTWVNGIRVLAVRALARRVCVSGGSEALGVSGLVLSSLVLWGPSSVVQGSRGFEFSRSPGRAALCAGRGTCRPKAPTSRGPPAPTDTPRDTAGPRPPESFPRARARRAPPP